MKLSLIILTLALSTTTVLGIYKEIDEEMNNVNKNMLLNAAIESFLESAEMKGMGEQVMEQQKSRPRQYNTEYNISILY